MWKFPIGFGKCSFAYLYIVRKAIAELIEDYLLSLEDINSKYKFNIFHTRTVLKSHKLIKTLYRYISFIIFGLLFFYIQIAKKGKKNEEKKGNKENKEEDDKLERTTHTKYIVNGFILPKKVLYELFIVCGLFTLFKVVRKIISFYKISDLDFWIFNIIFVTLYMHKYFGLKMYKHQKWALLFIFSTNCCLLSIAAFIPKTDGKSTTVKTHKWKCIFILLTYIILSWISSATKVASKKLMDINYISPYRIIFFMGVFGTIFSLIALLFTSNITCKTYCKVNEKNNPKKAYLDSLPIYFSYLKNANNKDFYVEIFAVIPLYIFFNFFEFVCEMLIILYLNPNYILIGDCIYYGTTKLIEFKIKKGTSPKKFCVEYIAEMLALIGYTIYLEIIELRFCNLDKNLKKNIMDRSENESLVEIPIDDPGHISDDEEEDDNDHKKPTSENQASA